MSIENPGSLAEYAERNELTIETASIQTKRIGHADGAI